MEGEQTLDERKTELVKTLGSARGHAILTTDRVIFGESGLASYNPAALVMPGTASGAKRARSGGKGAIEIPINSITEVSRVRVSMLNDGLQIITPGARYKFANLYKAWAPTIVDLLVRRYGRHVTPVADGSRYVVNPS